VVTARSLKEGEASVVSVSADSVNQANEGKLVHVIGGATTSEVMVDPDFGISANVIRLLRVVEMYQWNEEQHTEKRKTLGGGEETVTVYEYNTAGSKDVKISSAFKKPEGHR